MQERSKAPVEAARCVAHLTTVHHAADPRIFHKELGTLREAGCDVHLVAQHDRSETRRGIRITALPRTKSRYGRALLLPRAFFAARRLRADLYHIHDPELIPVAYALKRTTGAAVVYDMHENYQRRGGPAGWLLRALERWCFRWIDHVIVANAAHAGIPRRAGASATVVANYFKLPANLPAPAGKPPLESLRLVYTGVMAEQRGLSHLIDLAALVRRRRPAWRLELAGVCYLPEQRRRAEARLRQHGTTGTLHRIGWDRYVPWPQLMARCHAAHVGLALMNPAGHYPEVVPTKFYEYLHAGLPILCSDFPLWRAFVEENRCGAVVPPGDAEAAFRILKRWTDDPATYERLAAHARAAAPRYRWTPMGERLVRLYRRLLA